ncbi:MAG: TetR/AcrR family transcriptional regulator [Verrucomicrobiota bacterium]
MGSEDRSGRSRTPKGKASKNKILDMAEKVFSRKGFAASGISDVVESLGISAGALYHHFPSKKELMAGIAKRSMGQMCDQMDIWLVDKTLSPDEKMDLVLASVGDRRKLKKKLTRQDLGLVSEDAEVHEMVVQAGLEPVSERVSEIIRQGNATGDFQVQHPRATAIMIFLLLGEYMHRSSRLEDLVPEKTLESSFNEAVDQMLRRNKFKA